MFPSRLRPLPSALSPLCLFFFALTLLLPLSASAEPLKLWHAYRGEEQAALESVVDAFKSAHPGVQIEVLSVPAENYTNKLVSAIPQGNGPDVFIAPHDQTGSWSRNKLIAPLDDEVDQALLESFHPTTVKALRFEEKLYGLPVAYKSPVLFYNKALVPEPPADTEALFAELERLTDHEAQKYGLVYEETNLFFHSAWLNGFGGYIFDPETGEVDLANEGNAKSFEFVVRLMDYLPHRVDSARISRLFNEGDAAMVINGPWFMAQLTGQVDYGVATLPLISETGEYATPYVTAEGLFLSNHSEQAGRAYELLRYIATDGAVERAVQGKQMVAYLPAYDSPEVKADTALAAQREVFLAQLDHALPTSNRPEMSALWEPMGQALQKAVYGAPSGEVPYWMLLALVLISLGVYLISKGRDPSQLTRSGTPYIVGGVAALLGAIPTIWRIATLQMADNTVSAMDALVEAQSRYLLVQAPPAEAANPAPFIAVAGLILSILAGLAFFAYKRTMAKNPEYRDNRTAFFYIAPTAIAMILLIFTPFVVGAALSLFSYQNGEFIFVGLQNFARLFTGKGTPMTDSLSFYFTLVVTILWTALNVFLHVVIGVALAMLLRNPWLKLRGFYRVLLIIPWAIPNYITALIWRGMFDTSFGAINGILQSVGIEPVNWFDQFLTSFTANLTTNTWLGFPFMMVITLGALQSIPRDLEDAAAVDGANKWQRFKHVTLPLLKPALLPAVILGSVWTFNMFNIIYLVSNGGPDGSTEILISEAYKWAFERQFQYGYAAAYALAVFFILIVYTKLTNYLVRPE